MDLYCGEIERRNNQQMIDSYYRITEEGLRELDAFAAVNGEQYSVQTWVNANQDWLNNPNKITLGVGHEDAVRHMIKMAKAYLQNKGSK